MLKANIAKKIAKYNFKDKIESYFLDQTFHRFFCTYFFQLFG